MNLIACVDNNWGIGCNNELLFDIKADKLMFKEYTSNKAIIMGYNTWNSLPIRPLPNRTNIVMSLRHTQDIVDAMVFDDYTMLLKHISGRNLKNSDDVFVIGGQQIYELFLPYCDKAYITKVNATKKADTHFPNLDKLNDWKLIECKEQNTQGYDIAFCKYLLSNN